MKTASVSLEELQHPEENVRVHPQKQIDELARSVEHFGQIRPAIVDEHYTVLIGNGMVMAMEQLGWSEAEVYVYRGLSADKKRKLMLSDNRMSQLGTTDFDAQLDILENIIKNAEDYDIPGFDLDMLDSLVDMGGGDDSSSVEPGGGSTMPSMSTVGASSGSSGASSTEGAQNQGSSGEPSSGAGSADPDSGGYAGSPPSQGSFVRCPRCNGVIELEE